MNGTPRAVAQIADRFGMAQRAVAALDHTGAADEHQRPPAADAHGADLDLTRHGLRKPQMETDGHRWSRGLRRPRSYPCLSVAVRVHLGFPCATRAAPRDARRP